MLPRNGFTGAVTLEVLNLPQGVTSQTAASVTVTGSTSALAPFMLQAAADAPLGDHVVTVRGTSGALVREGSFTIKVVDHLPAPPPGLSMDAGFFPNVVGGGHYGAKVTISAPAPEDLAVFLSVEDPALVGVPASVIVPLGATSASFTITTPIVTANVGQSVRSKVGDDGWLGSTTLRMVPSAALGLVVLFPTSVVGGNSSAVNVSLDAAVAEPTVVALHSANPAVATVPASVTVPAGSSRTFVPIQTQAVTADATVAISAILGGVTRTAFLGVTAEAPPPPPPGGVIAIKAAQYDTAKQTLRVEVNDSSAFAQTITVSVTSTGQMIGTLANAGGGTFKGQFAWPVDPLQVTITSSLGWSITTTMAAK